MNFSKVIIDWYLSNKRDFPWRKTRLPYYIWLSEIILQQTRTTQGLPYYLKFIKAYPTVAHLAAADEQQLLKLWQGLGYYSRARNMHFTANYIVNELGGVFYNTFKEIKTLKGIGDYTASMIASVCFNQAEPAVDGNVYRVLSRYFGIDTPINSSRAIKEFKNISYRLISQKDPGIYNQAVMEFGALLCTPRNPACDRCPLDSGCISLQHQKIEQRPVKNKKNKIKKRYFNYLVAQSAKGETLLQQRQKKDIWQNLYEFPLVETPKQSCEKEIVKSRIFKSYFSGTSYIIRLYNTKPVVHKLSHQHLYTHFWIVCTQSNHENYLSWKEVTKFPVPVLIENFVDNFTRQPS